MSIKMYECDNCGNGDVLVMQNGLCEHCQPKDDMVNIEDAVTNATVDMVNSPNHYKQYDSIDGEVIDLIEEVERAYPLGLGYCIGNALKYILRAPFKGNMKQDLQKAIYYLERAVSKL